MTSTLNVTRFPAWTQLWNNEGGLALPDQLSNLSLFLHAEPCIPPLANCPLGSAPFPQSSCVVLPVPFAWPAHLLEAPSPFAPLLPPSSGASSVAIFPAKPHLEAFTRKGPLFLLPGHRRLASTVAFSICARLFGHLCLR